MPGIEILVQDFMGVCPIAITHASWSDPNLIFGGVGWSVSIDTYWRVERAGKMILGYAEVGSSEYFQSIVGSDVVSVRPLERSPVLDFEIQFSNGDRLVIFSLSRLENFVVRLPGKNVFVFIPD
ncbi:hypothetical protein D3C86_1366060 [compost metagenome]